MSLRILLADDHNLFRQGVRRILETQPGMQVVAEASSGLQAIDMAREHQPDVAIVDINLGQGPDFQVASQLSGRGVPFIFATGYDEKVIPAEFRQALTLQKPFDPQHLIAAVTSLRQMPHLATRAIGEK